MKATIRPRKRRGSEDCSRMASRSAAYPLYTHQRTAVVTRLLFDTSGASRYLSGRTALLRKSHIRQYVEYDTSSEDICTAKPHALQRRPPFLHWVVAVLPHSAHDLVAIRA